LSGRYKFIHIPRRETFVRETFNRASFAALGRLAILFVFVAVFWALWDQSAASGCCRRRRWTGTCSARGALVASAGGERDFILSFIPLCQYFVYPAIDRVWRLTALRKIGLGIFTIGAAFLISAWIESKLQAGLKPHVAWQVPAYALLSLGEVMASITALEFAYTQAPRHLKAIVQALYLLSVSGGNLFDALVTGSSPIPTAPRNCTARRFIYSSRFSRWLPRSSLPSSHCAIAKRPICKTKPLRRSHRNPNPFHPHESSPHHQNPKPYVGGAFIRSESGRTFPVKDAAGNFFANIRNARARTCATLSRPPRKPARAGRSARPTTAARFFTASAKCSKRAGRK